MIFGKIANPLKTSPGSRLVLNLCFKKGGISSFLVFSIDYDFFYI